MTGTRDQGLNRRGFVLGTVSGAALAMAPTLSGAGPGSSDKKTILAQIPKMHAENIKSLHEWSSPPLEGRLVPKEQLGTVCMGRGAVNQKGPQNAFLSALMAFHAAGKKLPVNLVLVCEGEEEIGSPHFGEIVMTPDVLQALKSCAGVLLPSADQKPDGSLEVELGAKGIVELELVASGEKWGRGPKKDIHSSLEAQVDSPSWHLVQALNTLV